MPPSHLTEGFFYAACQRHGRIDWLRPFDEVDGPVHGRLEATHLISRQRIRNILLPQLTPLYVASEWTKDEVLDLVEIAEWDPRNAGGLAYTDRHRRFDNQATPALRVPATALPADFLEFVDDWGFELEACRRFDGFDKAALGGELARGESEHPRVDVGAGTGRAAATAAGPGRGDHGQARAHAPADRGAS